MGLFDIDTEKLLKYVKWFVIFGILRSVVSTFVIVAIFILLLI